MLQIPNGDVGFIGLGAMGRPMAGHLARKLPPEKRIHVYDVVLSAVDGICTEYPNRVFRAETPREIADKCVRIPQVTLKPFPFRSVTCLIHYSSKRS